MAFSDKDREKMRKGYAKVYTLPENYEPGQELTDDMRAICGICGDFIDNGQKHGRTLCYDNTRPEDYDDHTGQYDAEVPVEKGQTNMEDQDIVDIAGLIYHKWADAMRTLDRVKDEKNDGSPDWEEFHADRYKAALAEEDHWVGVRNRYTEVSEHKAAINRMMGL